MKKTEINKIRHSLAHLLAYAALKFDPNAKFGIGPIIEDGFYYDILFSKKIGEDTLRYFEENIKEFIKANIPFKKRLVTIKEAKKIFKNQPFKLELIEDLEKYGTTKKGRKGKKIDKVSVYQCGEFIDLCEGPHVKNTKEINSEAFKLLKIAGAYWRGDEKNPMLTRIYGVAFENKEELDKYLERLEIAERYNHRVLGEELKIFILSEKVGKGLPIFLPRGEIIKHVLQEYMREKEISRNYHYVSTPVLASGKLYEASGHKKYFSEEMYKFSDPEGEEYFIKPMNCPHHHMVYLKLVQSYKDLPLKLAEAGSVYRFERSGVVYGLMRVRGPITQNDAHIYVTEEQLENEFRDVIRLLLEVYEEIKVFKNYWFRLSLPDFKGKNREKYGGDLKFWKWASDVIKDACKKEKLCFVEKSGEAAFYGPKLDMQIQNIYGKEETLATIQVDILVPKRMGLIYIDKDSKKKNPIIIHRAIIGSYERFIGFLLEETRGDLPLWLAPLQVVILPINDKVSKFSNEIFKKLLDEKIRAEIWKPDESLSKRILVAEKEKIPYMLIIGEKEVRENKVSVRKRKVGDLGGKKLETFIKELKNQIKNKE